MHEIGGKTEADVPGRVDIEATTETVEDRGVGLGIAWNEGCHHGILNRIRWAGGYLLVHKSECRTNKDGELLEFPEIHLGSRTESLGGGIKGNCEDVAGRKRNAALL